MSRCLQHRSLAKQSINRSLRGGLLDVLAPGREIASGRALGGLAVARPTHAAVLQQEHLGGTARERIGGDDSAGFFDRATTEESETHVTKLTGVGLWIAWEKAVDKSVFLFGGAKNQLVTQTEGGGPQSPGGQERLL